MQDLFSAFAVGVSLEGIIFALAVLITVAAGDPKVFMRSISGLAGVGISLVGLVIAIAVDGLAFYTTWLGLSLAGLSPFLWLHFRVFKKS